MDEQKKTNAVLPGQNADAPLDGRTIRRYARSQKAKIMTWLPLILYHAGLLLFALGFCSVYASFSFFPVGLLLFLAGFTGQVHGIYGGGIATDTIGSAGGFTGSTGDFDGTYSISVVEMSYDPRAIVLLTFALLGLLLMLATPFFCFAMGNRRNKRYLVLGICYSVIVSVYVVYYAVISGDVLAFSNHFAFVILHFTLGIISAAFYILWIVLACRRYPAVAQVRKEVDLTRGAKGVRTFRKQLNRYAKADDAAAFNGLLAAEHAYYLGRKAQIDRFPKEESARLLNNIYVTATVLDGTETGKAVRRQTKALYRARNYGELLRIKDAYDARFEVMKRERIAKEGVQAFAPEFDGKGAFDGWLIQRIGWSLLCAVVNLFTLSLAKPFTICWMEKWRTKHTVYQGKRLSFDGNGLQLFGKWIVWVLLTVVTLGVYGFFLPIRLEKWKAKHTHIRGEYKILGGTFDGWLIQSIGWSLLCAVVNLFTLYLAKPFTVCWKQKWRSKHRVYDGKRLKFNGNGLQLFGKWVLWWLLSLVTLGIYFLFLPIRLEKWKAKHTEIAEEAECVR